MLVPYTSTRDQNETTARRSNEYFSLSTNAHATSHITFPASSPTSNEVAHAIQAMRVVTRAGGKLSLIALAQVALSECWAESTNENDRVGPNGGRTEGEQDGGVDHHSGCVCWLVNLVRVAHLVGKKADVSRIKPVCWSPHDNAVFGGNIDSSGEYRRSSSNTVVDLFALVL